MHDRGQIEIFINKEHQTAEALAEANEQIHRLTGAFHFLVDFALGKENSGFINP
jgi:hypothetical protein